MRTGTDGMGVTDFSAWFRVLIERPYPGGASGYDVPVGNQSGKT